MRKKSKSNSSSKKVTNANRRLLYLVALVLVLAPVAAYLSVFQDDKNTKAAEGGTAIETVNWGRPNAQVDFVDPGNKRASCQGTTDVRCTTTKVNYFWPGSSLIYNVRAITTTGVVSNLSIKSGGTNATSDGKGKMDWSWTYTVVLFPTSKGDCFKAGGLCKTATLPNQTIGGSYRAEGLVENSKYTGIVCTPNCGNGIQIAALSFYTRGYKNSCITGNVNGDTIVNSGDQGLVVRNYTSKIGFVDKRYDVDKNDVVDVADFDLVTKNFGNYGCG